MNEEEIREILRLLREAGVKYEVCDTPVPVSGLSAVCGIPSEIGEGYNEDYVMVPKALVGSNPVMYIPVEGNSMIEAGYEPGDRLRVRFTDCADDGDDVVAMIDRKCTVKTLFTYEDGSQWLVPRNKDYEAIELTPDMDVKIIAVVVGVEKRAPRASLRDMVKAVRKKKKTGEQKGKVSMNDIEECIYCISDEITYRRHWYSVYRALIEEEVSKKWSIEDFCKYVERLLPEHEHLPNVKEMQRMAVLSFTKPIAQWEADNAPVKGMPFVKYKNIGLQFIEMLDKKREQG
ncbi:MAG: hypothetical protein J5905_01090 [Prevotella sp.]|nr:hypothetical protein [Prevotella sp.]